MKSTDAFERLERLLLQTHFADLTPRELRWLAEQGIDQEDYLQQQLLLQTAKATFTQSLVAPKPGIAYRNALTAQRSVGAGRILLKWGLLGTLLVGGFLLGRWSVVATAPDLPVPEVVKEEILIRDTVYIERVIESSLPPKILFRDRMQHDTVYMTLPVASNERRDRMSVPDGSMLSVTSPEELPNWSRNAKSTEELLKILVEVY